MQELAGDASHDEDQRRGLAGSSHKADQDRDHKCHQERQHRAKQGAGGDNRPYCPGWQTVHNPRGPPKQN